MASNVFQLFLCLGQDYKIDLMDILRKSHMDDGPLIEAITNSMKFKPKGHDFDLNRIPSSVVRFMSHTGG